MSVVYFILWAFFMAIGSVLQMVTTRKDWWDISYLNKLAKGDAQSWWGVATPTTGWFANIHNTAGNVQVILTGLIVFVGLSQWYKFQYVLALIIGTAAVYGMYKYGLARILNTRINKWFKVGAAAVMIGISILFGVQFDKITGLDAKYNKVETVVDEYVKQLEEQRAALVAKDNQIQSLKDSIETRLLNNKEVVQVIDSTRFRDILNDFVGDVEQKAPVNYRAAWDNFDEYFSNEETIDSTSTN
jgi:hypothetical protein